MSAEDIWQLKVPIRLCLSNSEITSPVDVKPVYLLAPRFAYLPALAQQCLAFFQHVLLNLPGQAATSPWFDHQGLPLNWTQPLGVLHDLLSPQLPATAATAGCTGQADSGADHFSAPGGPWCLTVHYRNMPPSLNNAWQNAGTAKDHFFSSLKEAGYCCRGSDGAGAVMRLLGQAQDELWAAVQRGDGASVRQALAALRLVPTPKQGGAAAAVPVRLYIRRHKAGTSTEGLADVWEHTYSSSRPVESTQPDGSPTLLAHLMHIVMPQKFPAPMQPNTSGAGNHQQQQQQQQQQQDQQRQQQQTAELAGDPQKEAVTGIPATDAPEAAAAERAAERATEQQQTATEGPSRAGTVSTDPLGVVAGNPAAAAAADGSESSKTAGESFAAADGSRPASGEGSEAAPSSNKTTAAPEAAEPAASAVVDHGGSSKTLPAGWPDASVFVCGIQPDWRTPLVWLHANLQAADCFLYVVVHLLEPS